MTGRRATFVPAVTRTRGRCSRLEAPEAVGDRRVFQCLRKNNVTR